MANEIPRSFGNSIPAVQALSVGVNAGIIPTTGVENVHVKAAAGIVGSKLAAEARRCVIVSPVINIDIGAGTTKDYVLTRQSSAITITAARIVYTEATAAAGATSATIKIGTAAGGEQIAAATNIEQPKAAGAVTAVTIVSGAVAANTPVFVRLTGVVATPIAGEVIVELEYTVNDAAA